MLVSAMVFNPTTLTRSLAVVALMAVLFPSHAFAQSTFDQPHVLFTATDFVRPVAVTSADLDGDGDLDLVALGANAVGWYANDGSGNFGSLLTIGQLALESDGFLQWWWWYFDPRIVVVDLDGDLDPDVALPDGSWFANDSHGSFEEQTEAPAPFDLARFGDIDADGDIDMVGALLTGDHQTIAVYSNDGDGQFVGREILHRDGQDYWVQMDLVDLDGDAAPELTLTTYWGPIFVYRNDGRGNFAFELEMMGTERSSFADADGDGDLDVFSSFNWPNRSRLWWNENDGTGGSWNVRTILQDSPASFSPPWPLDVDGDGDVDLVTNASDFTAAGLTQTVWFSNDGSGNFGEPEPLGDLVCGRPHVADLDTDGDRDFVRPCEAAGTVVWLETRGESALVAHEIGNGDVQWPIFISKTDVNGDGASDVLAVGPHGVSWVPWDRASGPAPAERLLSGYQNSPQDECYASADIDGDGDDDLISPRFWLELEPDAEYRVRFHGGGGGCPVVAADMDSDGLPDLITGTFHLFRNGGRAANWEFSWVRQISGDRASAFSTADLDLNGVPDLITVSDSRITAFVNDFAPVTVAELITDHIDAADLDGDGGADVVFGGAGEGSGLGWVPNAGFGGNFRDVRMIDAVPVQAFDLADMDGDGNTDVIAITDTDVRWYINQGNGSFGPARGLSDQGGSAVLATDMDGDGQTDVVAVSKDRTVVWYRQTTVVAAEEERSIPAVPDLRAPYPNPFAESATVTFDLPRTADVRLALYDVLGRERLLVAEARYAAGANRATVSARGLTAGTYALVLSVGDRRIVQMMQVVW